MRRSTSCVRYRQAAVSTPSMLEIRGFRTLGVGACAQELAVAAPLSRSLGPATAVAARVP
jgi:hypothetical protein